MGMFSTYLKCPEQANLYRQTRGCPGLKREGESLLKGTGFLLRVIKKKVPKLIVVTATEV